MKTIVIAGGGRGSGKTTCANNLNKILPSKVIKLGTHQKKENKTNDYLHADTPFKEVIKHVGECKYLIIESGRILDDKDLTPDLVIFLPAPGGNDKPGSEKRRARANIIRSKQLDENTAGLIRKRLEISEDTFNKIIAVINN